MYTLDVQGIANPRPSLNTYRRSMMHATGESARQTLGPIRDIAGASLIENWIDEAEHRVWFLYEATR
jgi:hypothetical protein